MKRISGVLAALALLAVAWPALASRAPSAGEKKAITTAIETGLGQENSPAAKTAHVFGIRISTKNGSWALAQVRAKNADDAYVALKKTGGKWSVKNLGTAQVQCGIGMPKSVMKELFADFGGANCQG